MRKNFLILMLLTLLPFTAWADEITVNLVNLQYEYGQALPDDGIVTPDMFSIQGGEAALPAGVSKGDVADALQINILDGPLAGVRNYHYSLTTRAGYQTGVLAGHEIFLFGGGNDGLLKIVPKPIDDAWFEIDGALTFNGTEQTQTFKLKTGNGIPTDVTFVVSNNKQTNAGNYNATITGTGNYGGEEELAFSIAKKTIAADKLSIDFTKTHTYTGADIEPAVTVKDMSLGASGTLLAATDYKVVYTGNKNATLVAGDTKLTVSIPEEGGNYTFASVDENFTINKHALTIAIKEGQRKVFGEGNPAKYLVEYGTGDNGFVGEETAAGLATLATPQFVEPTLTRVAGENAGVYAISITNAEAVVAGARNYDVQIADGTVNFSIQAKDLATATITLESKAGDDYKYNGQQHFKNVTVKFGNDALEETNYTVTTTKNINAGTGENGALVTVTGIGNYKGTKTANFDIAKADITIVPAVATKSYGTATDPDFTYTLKVGNETVPNSTLNGTVKLQREEGETVGAYKIWFKSYEAGEGDNYAPVNTATMATEVTNERYALFTITGSEGTLYLKFKSTAKNTKEYGASHDTFWSIADLEVDNSKGGLTCDDWDAVKYTFGEPVFAIASENVADNATNKVSVTNVLSSPIYPTVEVGTLPFTITAKNVALKVNDQVIAYGAALNQNEFTLADGYQLAGTEDVSVLRVTLATVNALGNYKPGTVTPDAIHASIDNANYNLVESACTWGKLTVNELGDNPDLALDDSKDDNLLKIIAFNNTPANVTIKFSKRNNPTFFGYGEWKADNWTTLVLPFDISVADLSKAFGYAIVNVINPDKTVVNGTNSEFYGKLTMKGGNGGEAEGVLAANKPILIKIADDIKDLYVGEGDDKEYYVVNFGSQTIKAPANDADLTVDADDKSYGTKFVGTYEKKTIGKDTELNDGNIWFMLGDYAKWAYINANSTTASWDIVPFAAYIDMSEVKVPVEAMTFHFEEIDGTVTAIKSINSDEIHGMTAKGMYNLNGMKLNSVPTQKGVYIVNGKKVVIK